MNITDELYAVLNNFHAGNALDYREVKVFLHSDIIEIAEFAEENTEETDYFVEGFLEAMQPLLPELGDEQLKHIALTLQTKWLSIEHVPGGTPFEIYVRVAELLGAINRRQGVDEVALLKQVHSNDWKDRLIAAWTISELDTEMYSEMRSTLSEDPFQDDNGYYLIREALGIESDDIF